MGNSQQKHSRKIDKKRKGKDRRTLQEEFQTGDELHASFETIHKEEIKDVDLHGELKDNAVIHDLVEHLDSFSVPRKSIAPPVLTRDLVHESSLPLSFSSGIQGETSTQVVKAVDPQSEKLLEVPESIQAEQGNDHDSNEATVDDLFTFRVDPQPQFAVESPVGREAEIFEDASSSLQPIDTDESGTLEFSPLQVVPSGIVESRTLQVSKEDPLQVAPSSETGPRILPVEEEQTAVSDSTEGLAPTATEVGATDDGAKQVAPSNEIPPRSSPVKEEQTPSDSTEGPAPIDPLQVAPSNESAPRSLPLEEALSDSAERPALTASTVDATDEEPPLQVVPSSETAPRSFLVEEEQAALNDSTEGPAPTSTTDETARLQVDAETVADIKDEQSTKESGLANAQDDAAAKFTPVEAITDNPAPSSLESENEVVKKDATEADFSTSTDTPEPDVSSGFEATSTESAELAASPVEQADDSLVATNPADFQEPVTTKQEDIAPAIVEREVLVEKDVPEVEIVSEGKPGAETDVSVDERAESEPRAVPEIKESLAAESMLENAEVPTAPEVEVADTAVEVDAQGTPKTKSSTAEHSADADEVVGPEDSSTNESETPQPVTAEPAVDVQDTPDTIAPSSENIVHPAEELTTAAPIADKPEVENTDDLPIASDAVAGELDSVNAEASPREEPLASAEENVGQPLPEALSDEVNLSRSEKAEEVSEPQTQTEEASENVPAKAETAEIPETPVVEEAESKEVELAEDDMPENDVVVSQATMSENAEDEQPVPNIQEEDKVDESPAAVSDEAEGEQPRTEDVRSAETGHAEDTVQEGTEVQVEQTILDKAEVDETIPVKADEDEAMPDEAQGGGMLPDKTEEQPTAEELNVLEAVVGEDTTAPDKPGEGLPENAEQPVLANAAEVSVAEGTVEGAEGASSKAQPVEVEEPVVHTEVTGSEFIEDSSEIVAESENAADPTLEETVSDKIEEATVLDVPDEAEQLKADDVRAAPVEDTEAVKTAPVEHTEATENATHEDTPGQDEMAPSEFDNVEKDVAEEVQQVDGKEQSVVSTEATGAELTSIEDPLEIAVHEKVEEPSVPDLPEEVEQVHVNVAPVEPVPKSVDDSAEVVEPPSEPENVSTPSSEEVTVSDTAGAEETVAATPAAVDKVQEVEDVNVRTVEEEQPLATGADLKSTEAPEPPKETTVSDTAAAEEELAATPNVEDAAVDSVQDEQPGATEANLEGTEAPERSPVETTVSETPGAEDASNVEDGAVNLGTTVEEEQPVATEAPEETTVSDTAAEDEVGATSTGEDTAVEDVNVGTVQEEEPVASEAPEPPEETTVSVTPGAEDVSNVEDAAVEDLGTVEEEQPVTTEADLKSTEAPEPPKETTVSGAEEEVAATPNVEDAAVDILQEVEDVVEEKQPVAIEVPEVPEETDARKVDEQAAIHEEAVPDSAELSAGEVATESEAPDSAAEVVEAESAIKLDEVPESSKVEKTELEGVEARDQHAEGAKDEQAGAAQSEQAEAAEDKSQEEQSVTAEEEQHADETKTELASDEQPGEAQSQEQQSEAAEVNAHEQQHADETKVEQAADDQQSGGAQSEAAVEHAAEAQVSDASAEAAAAEVPVEPETSVTEEGKIEKTGENA